MDALVYKFLFNVNANSLTPKLYKVMYMQLLQMINATGITQQVTNRGTMEFFFDCVAMLNDPDQLFARNTTMSEYITDNAIRTLQNNNLDSDHSLHAYNLAIRLVDGLGKRFNMKTLSDLDKVLDAYIQFPVSLVGRLQKINFTRSLVKVDPDSDPYNTFATINAVDRQIDDCEAYVNSVSREAELLQIELSNYTHFVKDLTEMVTAEPYSSYDLVTLSKLLKKYISFPDEVYDKLKTTRTDTVAVYDSVGSPVRLFDKIHRKLDAYTEFVRNVELDLSGGTVSGGDLLAARVMFDKFLAFMERFKNLAGGRIPSSMDPRGDILDRAFAELADLDAYMLEMESHRKAYDVFALKIKSALDYSSDPETTCLEYINMVNLIRNTYNVVDVSTWVARLVEDCREQNVKYSELDETVKKVSGLEDVNAALRDYNNLKQSYEIVRKHVGPDGSTVEWTRDTVRFLDTLPSILKLETAERDYGAAIRLYVNFASDMKKTVHGARETEHVGTVVKLGDDLNSMAARVRDSFKLTNTIKNRLSMTHAPSKDINDTIDKHIDNMQSILELFYGGDGGIVPSNFNLHVRRFINACAELTNPGGKFVSARNDENFENIINRIEDGTIGMKFFDTVYKSIDNVHDKVERLTSDITMYHRIYNKIVDILKVGDDKSLVYDTLNAPPVNGKSHPVITYMSTDDRQTSRKRKKIQPVESPVGDSVNIGFIKSYIENIRFVYGSGGSGLLKDIESIALGSAPLDDSMLYNLMNKFNIAPVRMMAIDHS